MKITAKIMTSALLTVTTLTVGMGTIVHPAKAATVSKSTEREARQAAAWQIYDEVKNDASSPWANQSFKLEKSTEVYDPSGDLIAYLVNVKMNGKPAGYVLVSAFEDEEPILEWSEEGEAFSPDKMKSHEGNRVSKSEKVVWLGGTNFAGEFEWNDGTTSLIDLNGIEVSKDKVKNMHYPTPVTEQGNAHELRKMMREIPLGDIGKNTDGVTNDDPSTFETDYLSIHRNYIDTTVNQKQWHYTYVNGVGQATGCSPTAASNLMKYWSDKGYTTLNPTGYQPDIVMSMRNYMGTYQLVDGTGETDYTNIDNGLQAYARAHGRPNAVATNHDLANFSTVVTEIDAQRPALQSYWGQYYFGDHTLTVIGYKEYVRDWYQANSYYVVVRNNFLGESYNNIYVRWGTWNTNVVTTFTP